MSATRRRVHKVMTQIHVERKRNWRLMQRAEAAGLTYDPLTVRLSIRQPGPRHRRCDWRRAMARFVEDGTRQPVMEGGAGA